MLLLFCLFLCFGLYLLAYLFSFYYYYCYYYYYYYYYYFKRGSPTGVLGYGICLIRSKDIIRDFKAKLLRDSGLKDYRGCGMSPKINIGITGLIEGKPSSDRHDGIRTEPY